MFSLFFLLLSSQSDLQSCNCSSYNKDCERYCAFNKSAYINLLKKKVDNYLRFQDKTYDICSLNEWYKSVKSPSYVSVSDRDLYNYLVQNQILFNRCHNTKHNETPLMPYTTYKVNPNGLYKDTKNIVNPLGPYSIYTEDIIVPYSTYKENPLTLVGQITSTCTTTSISTVTSRPNFPYNDLIQEIRNIKNIVVLTSTTTNIKTLLKRQVEKKTLSYTRTVYKKEIETQTDTKKETRTKTITKRDRITTTKKYIIFDDTKDTTTIYKTIEDKPTYTKLSELTTESDQDKISTTTIYRTIYKEDLNKLKQNKDMHSPVTIYKTKTVSSTVTIKKQKKKKKVSRDKNIRNTVQINKKNCDLLGNPEKTGNIFNRPPKKEKNTFNRFPDKEKNTFKGLLYKDKKTQENKTSEIKYKFDINSEENKTNKSSTINVTSIEENQEYKSSIKSISDSSILSNTRDMLNTSSLSGSSSLFLPTVNLKSISSSQDDLITLLVEETETNRTFTPTSIFPQSNIELVTLSLVSSDQIKSNENINKSMNTIIDKYVSTNALSLDSTIPSSVSPPSTRPKCKKGRQIILDLEIERPPKKTVTIYRTKYYTEYKTVSSQDQSTISLRDQNEMSQDQSTISSQDHNTILISDQNTILISDQSTTSSQGQSISSFQDQSITSFQDQNTILISDQSTILISDQSTLSLSDKSTISQQDEMSHVSYRTVVTSFIYLNP
ncbi:uncharacterized protein VNE69_04058 [Vairimorpha necatrix]|uniref:Uncharacterized protein n=2 Tax=Vairimorpha necatrix TaxID=6039 RepID=A0AAX4JB67_9MICR